jgi:hypothetical protein
MSFLIGFRARALAFALPAIGFSLTSPSGAVKNNGWGFLQSPAGLAVVALALMAVGHSVEETGGRARILLGIRLRVVAAALILPAALWAYLLGAPDGSLGFWGAAFTLAGGSLIAVAVRHDLGVHGDLRFGQALHLVSVSPDAIRLRAHGKPIAIPSSEIEAAAVGKTLEGRLILLEVRDRGRIVGDAGALPWIVAGRRGDTFALSEYQAGLDAEAAATQILAASTAAREKGYR